MKVRFLNLNSVAGKFLAIITVLLIAIPSCGWILERVGVHSVILAWIPRVSFWTGVGLLLVFVLLIILEQLLDARLFHIYRATRNRRIPLGSGYAECPNCGFRRLRDFETICPVCGKELRP